MVNSRTLRDIGESSGCANSATALSSLLLAFPFPLCCTTGCGTRPSTDVDGETSLARIVTTSPASFHTPQRTSLVIHFALNCRSSQGICFSRVSLPLNLPSLPTAHPNPSTKNNLACSWDFSCTTR